MELRAVILLTVVCYVVASYPTLRLGDPNTCGKNITVTEFKTVMKRERCPENYTTCTRSKCKGFISKQYPNCCCKNGSQTIQTIPQCCLGYRYDPKRVVCVPRCSPGFFNHPKTGKCTPRCNEECINSTCTAMNTCTCLEGYKKKNDYTCVPDCSPECVNSKCLAPNECSCFSRYKPDNSSYCSPICDNCTNGDCVAPDMCICHKGYTKKDDVCVPVCDETCNHGVCSQPNVCTCEFGYHSDPKNKFNCLPTCEIECVNASCVSPNTCSCYSGYEYAGNNWTCKPKCGECKHGFCVAPNNCQCEAGFEKVQSERGEICSPFCNPPCINGDCSAPDVCSCKDGYEKDEGDWSKCFKPCKGLCEDGTCTDDGICICGSGYELYNDTCSLMKAVDCQTCKANCSNPSACFCQDGRRCIRPEPQEIVPATGMAGWEGTWIMYVAVVLILMGLAIGVMIHIYKKRTQQEAKAVDCNTYGSVVYTVPDTLMNKTVPDVDEEPTEPLDEDDQAKQTSEQLLASESNSRI